MSSHSGMADRETGGSEGREATDVTHRVMELLRPIEEYGYRNASEYETVAERDEIDELAERACDVVAALLRVVDAARHLMRQHPHSGLCVAVGWDGKSQCRCEPSVQAARRALARLDEVTA